MRIIDCVVAYNETDMFDIRTRELREVVNAFVLVEATKTHTGVDKPLFFSELSHQPRVFDKKMVYNVIRDMPNVYVSKAENNWILEHFQRECIMRGVGELDPADQDIMLVSDMDEVPRAECVALLPTLLQNFRIVIFEQKMTKFFLNNRSRVHHNQCGWFGTIACKYETLKGVLPQAARMGDPILARSGTISDAYPRDSYPYEYRIKNSGWHFSSMGGVAAYVAKLRAVAEGWANLPDPILTNDRFGRHNHARFRTEHASVLAQYLRDHAPELIEIRDLKDPAIAGLDIPLCLRDDPSRFEHLFYLSNTIDD